MVRLNLRRAMFLSATGFVLLAAVALLVMIATDPSDNMVLVEHQVQTDSTGARVLTGTYHNRGDFPSAGVEIGFLDANDNPLGSARASTRDLVADEMWVFRVPVSEDAARFRVLNLEWNDGERHFSVGTYRIRNLEDHWTK